MLISAAFSVKYPNAVYQIKSSNILRNFKPPNWFGNFLCSAKFINKDIGKIVILAIVWYFILFIYYLCFSIYYLSEFAVKNIRSRMFANVFRPTNYGPHLSKLLRITFLYYGYFYFVICFYAVFTEEFTYFTYFTYWDIVCLV